MRRVLVATFLFSGLVWSCADWDALGCDAGDVSYCRATGGGEPEGGGSGGGGAGGGGAGGGGAGGGGGEVDAGEMDAGARDSGSDAGTDAGVDAGTDAGTDAGIDAGIDAGSSAGLTVTPNYGRQGDTIQITGGFSTATAVEFVSSSTIRTSCTNLTTPSMGTATCRVPLLPLGRYSVSVTAGGTTTEPDAFFSMGQPVSWLDITRSSTVTLNSTTVAAVSDRMDAGIVVANNNPSNQPVFEATALQGLDTLGFNVQTSLELSTLPPLVAGNGARVVALVGRFTSGSTSGWIFGYGGFGGANAFSIEQASGTSIKVNNVTGSLVTPPMFTANTPFYFIVHCPGGTVPLTSCLLRANGSMVGPTATGNASSNALSTTGTGLFLGRSPGGSFTGDLSEVVVYGLMTGTDVDALEQHLRAKYSL